MAAGLSLSLPQAPGLGAEAGAAAADSCPPAQGSRPWQAPAGPDAEPPLQQPRPLPSPLPGLPAGSPPGPEALPAAASDDYRQVLEPTAAGWPLLVPWCVWVEPSALEGPAARFDQRWLDSVEAALGQWQGHLRLLRVEDPGRAQVLIRRRRPARFSPAPGIWRASHGRANLSIQEVERQGSWRLEPKVEVLISPDQRREAIEATALHELGHAFGLWGHSPEASDAMAAVPGARPVLELSARDLATLRWLYAQPSRFGLPVQGGS